MDLADGHIILVAEACQALDMQLLVVSFPEYGVRVGVGNFTKMSIISRSRQWLVVWG